MSRLNLYSLIAVIRLSLHLLKAVCVFDFYVWTTLSFPSLFVAICAQLIESVLHVARSASADPAVLLSLLELPQHTLWCFSACTGDCSACQPASDGQEGGVEKIHSCGLRASKADFGFESHGFKSQWHQQFVLWKRKGWTHNPWLQSQLCLHLEYEFIKKCL